MLLDEPFNDLEYDTSCKLKEYILANSVSKLYIVIDHTKTFDVKKENIITLNN